jgi:FixJ family two-component response regulator
MRPAIFYVDDQGENLALLKGVCPAEWDVFTYLSPVEALKELEAKRPWVILSDQKMPLMAGFQFLELCRGIAPAAARIIVTGHSDEELIVSSIRNAHITDLILKPWNEGELLSRIAAAIGHYRLKKDAQRFEEELIESRREAKELASQLAGSRRVAEILRDREAKLKQALVSWVPPFIVDAIEKNIPLESVKRDVASIAFDLKNSARLIGIAREGAPIRNKIVQAFTASLHRHRGRRESVTGDSSYGHFGLMSETARPAESALSAALDFRTELSNLEGLFGLEPRTVAAGIALHFANELPVHIHTSHFRGDDGEPLAQNSFDTSSFSSDLLHRIEKLTHPLSGTNIIMTKPFVESLGQTPPAAAPLGEWAFSGHDGAVELFLLPSSEATEAEIDALRRQGEKGRAAKAIP